MTIRWENTGSVADTDTNGANVAESIAELLDVAELHQGYPEECLATLEEVLTSYWSTFNYLEDITVSFTLMGVHIHTNHIHNSSDYWSILITPGGIWTQEISWARMQKGDASWGESTLEDFRDYAQDISPNPGLKTRSS